ncbi:hypothetical protein KM043_015945 [Ampulex compressa]|nr:hypothetical protein KM043_015945 [Ampulex compressa]
MTDEYFIDVVIERMTNAGSARTFYDFTNQTMEFTLTIQRVTTRINGLAVPRDCVKRDVIIGRDILNQNHVATAKSSNKLIFQFYSLSIGRILEVNLYEAERSALDLERSATTCKDM